MTRARFAAVMTAAVLLPSLAAAATSEAEREARTHFQAGEARFKAGAFDEALAEYQKGYEAKPLPGFLVNIAQCQRRLGDLKSARAANAPKSQVSAAQDFQRKAQFYLDFVEAENSSGFHAPQEALRILGESINFTRKGQLALRSPGQPGSESVRPSIMSTEKR